MFPPFDKGYAVSVVPLVAEEIKDHLMTNLLSTIPCGVNTIIQKNNRICIKKKKLTIFFDLVLYFYPLNIYNFKIITI